MFLFSCGPGADPHTLSLNRYLEQQFNARPDTSRKGIVVLTMNGCYSCNRSYLQAMRMQADLSGYAVLVSAPAGTISPAVYEHKGASPVWKDYHDRFYETGLMKSSGLICLDRGRIDTIVDIRSEGLHQQIDYIRQRLAQD